MDNAPLEKDSNTRPNGDINLKMGLDMTQCNVSLKSFPEKRKRKRPKKRKNSLESKDIDDNCPKGTSINVSPIIIDSVLHPPVNTCLSTDLEMTQHDAEVILTHNMDNGEKQNEMHNALTGEDTNQDLQEGGRWPVGNSVSEVAAQLNSFQKCLDASSTKKHDDHAQVDITFFDMSDLKTYHRKKRVKMYRRKKRKFHDSIKDGASSSVLCVHDSSVRDTSLNHSDQAPASGNSEKMMGELVAGHDTSLEETHHRKKRVKMYRRERRNLDSTKDGASSSVLQVQDSSARDTSLNHSDQVPASGDSEKMMGELVAGHGASLLIVGDISLKTASGECPDSEPKAREQEKKIKIENFQEINTSLLIVGDISLKTALGECPDSEPTAREQEKKIKIENFQEIINEQEKKIKLENLHEIINEQSVVKDVSQVDLPEKKFEQGNGDKIDAIQNAVLDVYSGEETFHNSTTFYKDEKKTSDDASGSDPSIENIQPDNLVLHPKSKDATPSSSQVGTITDDVSLAVIGKEGPRPRLRSLLVVPPGNLRKKLLVLDVNGLLADIVLYVSDGYKPDTIISKKAVFRRPFCDDFLEFCFERFHVGVWSSRTKRNVELVLDFLMGKSKRNLLFCWDQSHCTDTGFNTVENRDKPLLLKELKKLWEKHEPDLPWEKGEYDESNTLLLDDSPYKALRNPPHTAIFPDTYQYKDVNDNSLGPTGDLRVYLEGLAMADNVQKYVELNPFGQRPITKANLSWAFYLKIIGTTSSLTEEEANDSSACQ